MSIRNTLAASYAAISRTVGGVAARAEREKQLHYSPLANDYLIVPFIVESSGLWGQENFEGPWKAARAGYGRQKIAELPSATSGSRSPAWKRAHDSRESPERARS